MTNQTSAPLLDPFTGRELQILRLLARGLSDRDISEALVITLGTVKWYNRQIYSKLGVGSRTQAIARAGELRLLEEGGESPPPALALVQKHNLPAETAPFIGRRRELADLTRLLAGTRLLTITGAGGSGKTRLALHLAGELRRDFEDGVYLVPLAPLADPALVAGAVAAALGVTETAGTPLLDALKYALHNRHLLLLLDNLEHLLPAAPLVADLLATAPRLKVLATSREALRLYGEQEFALAPLELPDPAQPLSPEIVAECESVALFVQAARAVKPDFVLTAPDSPAVAEICLRLDGLPLGIELAAARVKLLSPAQLLDRLGSRLTLLTGGARDLPARQQTLRRTIDWSYDLLDDDEKRLFARLSVFAGGWTLDAVESVCGEGLPDPLDVLAALIDKSLVRQQSGADGEPRFSFLETIREYAADRLQTSPEAQAIGDRHTAYFLGLALRGRDALDGHDQIVWSKRLESDLDNLRAVMDRVLQRGEADPGLKLVEALWVFWCMRGRLAEGRRWSERILQIRSDDAPEQRARAIYSTAMLSCYLQDLDHSAQLAQQALALAQTAGDKLTEADSLICLTHSRNLDGLTLGDYQRIEADYRRALALYQQVEDDIGVARALGSIASVLRRQGKLDESARLHRKSEALFRELGNIWRLTVELFNLGFMAQSVGDHPQAEAHFREILVLCRDMDDHWGMAFALQGFAGSLGPLGQPERAARLLGAGEAVLQTLGVPVQADDRPDYDRAVNNVRALLPPEQFAALWAEGRALPLDRAVADALES